MVLGRAIVQEVEMPPESKTDLVFKRGQSEGRPSPMESEGLSETNGDSYEDKSRPTGGVDSDTCLREVCPMSRPSRWFCP
jgi:hypothetical protein